MQHGLRHFRRIGHATERIARGQLSALLGAELLERGRVHRARTHRVDANAGVGVVERHAAHQADETVLGHVVGDLIPLADHPRRGRDAHDRSATGPLHVRDRVAGAQVGTGEVDPQHPVPVRFVHLGDAAGTGDPGVVHQHVQAAQVLHRRGHQRLNVRDCGDVCSYRDRRAAVGVEPVRRCRDGALVQVGQDDRCSLAHEQLGHRQTEPSSRSGDHRALARQEAHSVQHYPGRAADLQRLSATNGARLRYAP